MVVCNGCGGLCVVFAGGESCGDYGLIEAEVVGGYHSTELRDLTRYRFSLCEACLVRLFDGFAVPPQVDDLCGDGQGRFEERPTTWCDDRLGRVRQQVREAYWRAWRCPKCGAAHEGCASGHAGYESFRCEVGHEWVWLRVLSDAEVSA
jgi:hypothetical protein